MRSVIMIALVLIASTTSRAQIGAKTQQGKIFGTWVNQDFGYTMTLQLNADGQGSFDGSPINFRTKDATLSVTQDGTINNYTYLLKDNVLTLSGGDLDAAVSFTRQGNGSQGTVSHSKPPMSAQTSATAEQGIVGVWANYGETIEFKSDGHIVYQGQQYSYTVNTDRINVSTGQGDLVMAYKLAGSQLHLTLNGQNLVYERGKAGSVSQGTRGRAVDQSMQGKWCYVNVTNTNSGGVSSDACITLNADGTYQYYSERSMSANTNTFSSGTSSQNSDRGTWWVDGDKIYYQSQTQGQGSYTLQKVNHPKTGDPMIVLDGSAYVTFYNKAPW
jgi:hypothetical protein